GDAFTQGSWAMRASSTYAKRYKYNGNVQVAFTRNKFGDREDPTNYLDERNYNIIWSHRMDPKARPNTNFGANVNYQSPRYQQLNAYNPANIVQSAVYSSINYNKVMGGGKYSLGLTGTASQNNQTKDVSLTLPQLTFDVLRFFPFQRKVQVGNKRWYEEIGMNYSFNAQNNINTKDSLLLRPETLQEMQNGAVHRSSISTQIKVFKYFSLNPSISANEYWYLQTINRTWNSDSLRVETDTIRGFSRTADFNFNANLSTNLYGMFQVNARKLRAVRHVMNITANIGFRPDFSDAGFGNYRRVQSDTLGNEQLYSIYEKGLFGGPAQGRVGQVGLGINNNVEMKVRKYRDTGFADEKVKIFETFAISSNYNFFAEEFQLSPISMSARTVLFKQVMVNVNGVSFDPYALDTAGRRKNVYLVKENGKLARFTNGQLSVSTSINSKMFDGKTDASDDEAPQPGVSSLKNSALAYNPNLTAYELSLLSSIGDFVDFDVPWSLTLNYNYNYNRPGRERTISQNVTFSGDMNLTQNWKIAFSSGYDFTRKEVNLTSVDIYRQLHCWEFKFSWVPLGFRQYFLFNLNVKSSVLKDLKVNRRRDWYDNN
ncbi:MAG TPA: putative LPS assembly protein LptD, partial [Bacteroidia bacterium]|nr:putative LPS assembly protein LptD [Bacteroidia bacterium]